MRSREHLPVGGRVLDIGAGAVLVGDRIADIDAEYVALEFSARNVQKAAEKFADRRDPLTVRFVRGDAEQHRRCDDRLVRRRGDE